jgi:PAS domain S-box-containing protein
VRHRDGSVRIVRVNLRTTLDRDADSPVLDGIVEDMTEQVRAEEERLAHARHLEVLDRTNRAIQAASEVGELLREVLDCVLEACGGDRAWLAARTPNAGWSLRALRGREPGPADLEAWASVFAEAGAAGRAVRAGNALVTTLAPRVGGPWALVVEAPGPDPTVEPTFLEIGRRLGEGLSLLLAFRDLRRNESRLRTLVQSIPDLVWLKDRTGAYIGCNPPFERMLGRSEAEIIGQRDEDLLPPELAAMFQARDFEAVGARESRITEEWIDVASTGRRGLFETIRTPMWGPAGTLAGVLGISRDITARKEIGRAHV